MITIDRATMADVPRMVELLGILFSQETDFSPDPEKQRQALEMMLADPNVGVLFVAREDGEVLGMLSVLTTISTATGARAGWLEDMIVSPALRGTGIGSKLIDHAITHATKTGLTRLTLLTDWDNDGAIRFYQRKGFEQSAMQVLRLKLPSRNSE